MPPFDREGALKSAEKALKQGRIDAAIAEYVKVVEAQPRDWNSANALGDLYVRANQLDKGLTQYTRIADHLATEGFYPKAAALYKKILKLKPDDEYALMQSADLATKQGTLADAKKLLQTVAELRNKRGDKKGAAEISIRLGMLDPEDLDARLRAARAAADMGDKATALQRVPRCRGPAREERQAGRGPRGVAGGVRSRSGGRRRPRQAAGGLRGGRRARHGAQGGARCRRAQADRAGLREGRPGRRGPGSPRRSGRPRSGGRRSARGPRARLRVAWRSRAGAHLPVGGNRRRQCRAVADAGRNRIAGRPQRRRPGRHRPGAQARSRAGAKRRRGRLPPRRIESGGGLPIHRRRGGRGAGRRRLCRGGGGPARVHDAGAVPPRGPDAAGRNLRGRRPRIHDVRGAGAAGRCLPRVGPRPGSAHHQ